MKPFTLADIGKPVRIKSTGAFGRVAKVMADGMVEVLLDGIRATTRARPSGLERGHFVTTWVPDAET